ncbi:hypothetical protein [Mesobacillus foraminis]|uniref:Uncharacterized protein n=1 Tax=Mesobacillus foraminis TaxID=279826 RepID=A0A4R2BJ47_9BACI|nr:hypothetical protein [Mesobacillus foraminis]TCN26623.1 hypothetical protein EV146_103146 [Mesobacillus foraminis]
MNVKKIEKLVNDLVLRSGTQAAVKLEASFPGDRIVGGKYSVSSHSITMYIEEIEIQCLQLFATMDHFTDYFKAVFAHEIGHAEDTRLEELSAQLDQSESDMDKFRIALEIEENAWAYARKLTPEINEAFFNTIVHQSTKAYKDKLGASYTAN